ncbi:hypothetical protein Patl1_03032 [Pistacia atlantica]|uniref:Uncharacterized protein n=1 Tax=Pistacia atlantica TaxID=434234 RepID=A0ACC1CDC5_9ROSI|nr:hypothetical protein Patl1_03032 [Pistacia atlantica]
MAEAQLSGHQTTSFLRSHSLLTATTRRAGVAPSPSRVSFDTPKAKVLAMAIKRSPKRLKYSSPQFTKEDRLMYVEVDPSGADCWKLEPVVELLKEGAVGVIPTDTVYGTTLSLFLVNSRLSVNTCFVLRYAIVCHLKSQSAIERLRRIKNIEPSKVRNIASLHYDFCSSLMQPLSILCRSLRDIDIYTTGFPRGDGQGHANIFRAVKHCLPGPYTFILTASKELPKQCVRYGTTTAKYASRKNVGVRIPDDAICQAILEKMDAPLISTSAKWPKENEWMMDPVVIADIYGPEGLDFVVDGGVRVADPSTVVDMTGAYPKIIRQGKGPKLPWMEENDA